MRLSTAGCYRPCLHSFASEVATRQPTLHFHPAGSLPRLLSSKLGACFVHHEADILAGTSLRSQCGSQAAGQPASQPHLNEPSPALRDRLHTCVGFMQAQHTGVRQDRIKLCEGHTVVQKQQKGSRDGGVHKLILVAQRRESFSTSF